MRAHDTHPEAHRAQIEAVRAMAPARRVQLAFEMSERARAIAIEGALSRDPGLGREGATRQVLRRILGDALFEAAYSHRRVP